MMANVATRRFLGLNVGEISIVDDNAIETPVAVMKRKETESMTTPADNAKQKTAVEAPGTSATDVTKAADADANTDTVEVEHSASADVIKRLLTTVELLIEKSVGSSSKPTSEKDVSENVVKAALVATGLSEEQIAKAMAAIATPLPTEVEKSIDSQEAQMQVLEVLAESITKAKKFTPKRLGELETAVATLTGLLADLQSTADVEKSAVSPASAPTEAPAPTEVAKSKVDAPDIAELVTAAVAKALAPLTTELEILKSTRTPATSTAGDVTETTPTTNGQTVSTQKGFWNGVL
jgi:hypothetical protein